MSRRSNINRVDTPTQVLRYSQLSEYENWRLATENSSAWNSAEKALAVAAKIVLSDGNHTLREIADDLNLTVPTIYRHVAALQDQGFLTRLRRGSYVPGPTLQAIAGHCSKREMVRKIARPILTRLSSKLDGVCHMGAWDDDMVTYVIKSAHEGNTLFTQETMQQEGYCSGLGKVLLSTLDSKSFETYLNAGEFLRLTENTITDPDKLREEIYKVKKRQYALDNREIREDLICIAIPIVSNALEFPLAISLSRKNLPGNYFPDIHKDLHQLRQAGNSIASMLNSFVAR